MKYMMEKFLFFAFLAAPLAVQSASVFKIGNPDGYSSEFRLFRNLGDDRHRYESGYDEEHRSFRDIDGAKKFFSKPVVYTAGKSNDRDWPFVHPVANCEWAGVGVEPKSFKIEFDTPKNISKSGYYFKMGFTDSAPTGGFSMKVSLNGKPVGARGGIYKFGWRNGGFYAPAGANLLSFPLTWGVPSSVEPIKIPAELLKKDGTKNVLEIAPDFDRKTRMKIWATYDWLELSDNPDMPKIPDRRAELPAKAIEAMGTEEIVFCTRGNGRDWHWYANYGKSVCSDTGIPQIDRHFNQELFSRLGGKLAVYNLKTGKIRYLIDDPKGCVRDPQVSYDGKKIIFSYRKGDDDLFHIYEIGVDGKNLTKLPFAGNWNDIEPCYMPNGDILYTSDRLNKTVQCFYVPVSNLHRWFREENFIACITVNPDVDNRPEIMPDGRIIYMRWDYNHRTQLGYHNLWTIGPDGYGDMIYLGNEKPGGLYIAAKPLPDKDGILFTLAPGHGMKDHCGNIARAVAPFDPSDPHAFEFVSGEYHPRYYDPYPLKGNLTLATDGEKIVVMSEGGQFYDSFPLPEDLLKTDVETYYTVVQNKQGRVPKCKVLIRNPQPLAPRKAPQMRPDMADFSQKTATVFMQDVYHGRKMADVKRGTIKKLMITQMLPEPVHYHGGFHPINFQGGFALEKVLGTVPVYPDGSAFFEVPASKALAFVALDENGNAVKRMQSFTGFAPGTSTSCIGCHERRTEAPIRKQANPMAYGKLSKIEKIDGVPQMIDYMRHIQPLFDKYCVKCHNPRNANAGVIMTGDLSPHYIQSRFVLAVYGQLNTGFNKWGNQSPYTFGSGGSKLMRKAEGGHHNEKFEQKDLNLLRAWLDTGSFQVGTYAMAGTGFLHNDYEGGSWVVEADIPDSVRKINDVVYAICGKCHKEPNSKPAAFWWNPYQKLRKPDGKGGFTDSKYIRDVLYNLTTPEESVVLLVPLAKEHGGLAEGVEKKSHPIVFRDKNDYEYKKMLSGIREVSEHMKKTSPFQTEKNFFPTKGYIKVLQKCGIIPADYDYKTPVDAMELDEKYFKWQEDNIIKKLD